MSSTQPLTVPEALTVGETAALVGLTPTALRQRIRRNRIEVTRDRGHVLVPMKEVERLASEAAREAAAAALIASRRGSRTAPGDW